MRHEQRMIATGAALAGIGLLGLGCAQQAAAPEPQHPQFRHAQATAPADLQLACAGEAAERYEMPGDQVLPIASSVAEDHYTVVVNAGGTHAICTIDAEGNVLSVVEA